MEEKTVKKILNFWFGEINKNGIPYQEKQKMWWIKDKKLDELIKNQFENHLISAKSVKIGEISDNPDEMLAYVILLDQFSRNIYRETPGSFLQDTIALNITLKGIISGADKEMMPFQRAFFYMPLMHSEDIDIQKKSVDCFSNLEKEYENSENFAQLVKQNKKYAVLHYDIIEKYGRYPHRNVIVGRESTADEIEFLKGPGSSF